MDYIERNKIYELIGQTGVARIHVSDMDGDSNASL